MIQHQFEIVFNLMYSNWNYGSRTPEERKTKALLVYSNFRHLTNNAFSDIINELLSDTGRRDTFPTIAQIRNVEKKYKPPRESVSCVVCESTGIVSMLHVFNLPISDRDRPDFIRYADYKTETEIRNDEDMKAWSYSYSCLCDNAINFRNKRITQDQFNEIKEFIQKV